MSKEDGGPAFPNNPLVYRRVGQTNSSEPINSNGMSLRDYFAGQAVVIMLRTWRGLTDEAMIKQWGVSAYLVADAMIAERNK